MTMLIEDRGYTPRYYNPDKGKTITGDHVERFYGALLGKMLSGSPSNIQMFSTREIFDAVEPVKNSLTLDAMKDLRRYLHFADDGEEEEEEEWEETYGDSKEEAPDTTARHQKKFSMVEDAYKRRWQAMVNFGKWITADESRVAGWYHSVITCGPGIISFRPIRPICCFVRFG